MTSIRQLREQLYADRAESVLYHYTSLSGLEAIMQTRSLWASEIRYLNDAAEMQHTAKILQDEITGRLQRETGNDELLTQLRDWVLDRMENGHMLFVVSFTTNGNLLSQWRGYGNVGKGVSLGLDPDTIYDCADRQHFQVGRCIYDDDAQKKLAEQIVSAIETMAGARNSGGGESPPGSPPYHDLFESVEADLLRIATLLKHPSFKEEDEWRVVSPVFTGSVDEPISYREGLSMLVPYIEFRLDCTRKLDFQHIYLGPTPNISLSMASLARFLSRHGIIPAQGIMYCDIPYRKW